MKTPLRFVVSALVSFALLSPCALIAAEDDAKSAPAAKEQLDRLQGEWVGVERGREFQGDSRLTITGDAIHFQGANKGEWYKGTIKLPPGSEPKQLVATIKECPAEEMVGKSSAALYKLEDGTLTLVGNRPGTPGPKTLQGDEASRTFILKKAPAPPK